MGKARYGIIQITKSILNNKKIEVFNYGKHSRDFTYIDDIVNGILLILNKIPKKIRPLTKRKIYYQGLHLIYIILEIQKELI